MSTSANGRQLLTKREGVVLKAYRDSANLLTIGVGHLLTREELQSGMIEGIGRWTEGITAAEADTLLQRDLAIAEAAVTDAVAVDLSANQYDALVSYVFNVGVQAFRDSTLLRLLNEGNYAAVPGQLRRWVHAGGKVDPGLIRRRESEIAQWEAG